MRLSRRYGRAIGTKVHIGRSGEGSLPVCVRRMAMRSSGVSVSLAEFENTPQADRCARCEKKLPIYRRLAAKKAESSGA